MKNFSGKFVGAILAILSICCMSSKVQAAAIQSSRNAAAFDMFMPADDSSYTPKRYEETAGRYEVIAKAASKNNEMEPEDGIIGSATVNYNEEIANALFDDADEDVVIEVDRNTKRIFVPEGRKVIIKLIESGSSNWHYECEELLSLASNDRKGNNREMVFNAGESGTTKLYLDYVDKSGKEFKVVESVYINVIVG